MNIILDAIRTHIPRKTKLLLAVSGGKDSVVLLHACYSLMTELELTLEVAHIDHAIRETSKRDAKFVQDLASSYNLPFHLFTAQEVPSSGNIEAWGRQIRYKFFSEILIEKRLDYILTAHTASDVAETLLMRLLSNKELTSIDRIDERRHCLRPLLDISRALITEYQLEYKLEYYDDETNSDVAYLRNRVRHHLLPFLKHEFNENIEELLVSRARALADDKLCLSSFIEESVNNIAQYELFSKKWRQAVKRELGKLPNQMRWRLAEVLLLPVLKFPLGRLHGKRAADFLFGLSEGVELPSGVRLVNKNGGVLKL